MIDTSHQTRTLVTGASRGIGAATARLLAGRGHRLLLTSFADTEALKAVAAAARAAGADVVTLDADLADRDTPQRLMSAAVHAFDGLDAVVNNAFWQESGGLADVTRDGWDRTLAVCLSAAAMIIKEALPTMLLQGSGAIVNVASGHAVAASPGFAAYEAAKSGLLGLTRSVAVEYGPGGIRCNTVCPGLVLSERILNWWDAHPEVHAAMLAAIPSRRAGQPSDIAHVIAFLIDDARFVNGANIAVDGGETASLPEAAALALITQNPTAHRSDRIGSAKETQ